MVQYDYITMIKKSILLILIVIFASLATTKIARASEDIPFTFSATNARFLTQSLSTMTGLASSTPLGSSFNFKNFKGDYPDESQNPCATNFATIGDAVNQTWDIGDDVTFLLDNVGSCGSYIPHDGNYWFYFKVLNGDRYYTAFSYSSTTGITALTHRICPSGTGVKSEICEVYPINGSLVTGTSTTPVGIGVKYWVSIGDNALKVRLLTQYNLATVQNRIIQSNEFIATSTGIYTNYATTTGFADGTWNTRAIYISPSFHLFGSPVYNPFSTADGQGNSGMTSIWSFNATGSINEIFASWTDNITACNASSTCVDECNSLTGFFADFGVCLGVYVVPTSDGISGPFNEFKDSFLTRFPVGYITRIYDIMSTSSTSTLPSIVLHMPSSSPLAGTTTVFNTDEIFISAVNINQNILVDENGESLWDIVMPTIRIIIYVLFSMYLFRKLFNLDLNNDDMPDINHEE